MVVAFAVLGLTLGAVYGVFSAGLRNVGAADRQVRAAVLGESIVASVGEMFPLEPGEVSGEEAGGYGWTLTIAEYGGDLAGRDGAVVPVRLYQVDVLVRWGDKPRAGQVALTTLRVAAAP